MSLREDLARNGNGKSIMRMHDAGMKKHQISGVFKDNGIPAVTPKVVQGVIDSHTALGTRALEKNATKDAIKQHKAMQNPGSASGMVPV